MTTRAAEADQQRVEYVGAWSRRQCPRHVQEEDEADDFRFSARIDGGLAGQSPSRCRRRC